MKRLITIYMAVFFVSIFVFSGTGFSDEKKPYPVGVVLDLTGRYSSIAIPEKRGLEIAIDRINAAGGMNGRKLKSIVYDGESNTSKAVLHTKRLINVDNVAIIAGFSSSGSSLASIPIAQAAKVPFFSAGSSQKIWIPTKKWAFNVVPRQKEASIPTLLKQLQKDGSKKSAYIYIDMVYGQTGKETLDWACQELNIQPAIVEKYAPGSTDVGPQITHIKASEADGLLITGLLADTVMVIKNARDLGFTYPIVSDYAIVGPEFIKLAGKYGEGIVTTSIKTLVAKDLPDNDIQKKTCMALYDEYTKKHGAFSLYAGHTWDQIYLIAEALKKVDPNLDPGNEKDLIKIRQQLRDNIEEIKGFVGQNGVFNYSPDNHNGLGPECYVPVIVKDGKWRLLK